MKKVKYKGEYEVIIPLLGKVVNKDDVIEVEDNFFNAQFEEIVEKPQLKDGGK